MHIKLKLDNTTLPKMTEYSGVPFTEPTLMKIAGTDGGTLKLGPYTSIWISEDDYFRLERLAQKEYNNDSKPQSNTVSANDLLKAIAITKDPTLALQLIKE